MIAKTAMLICLLLVPLISLAFGDDKPVMTQVEFLDFFAKGLLHNTNHCPNTSELSQEQSKSLIKFGQQIMQDDDGFKTELQTRLQAVKSGIVLKKMKECPEKIAVRGPQRCYSVMNGSQKVVDFIVGPYSNAGIDCMEPTKASTSNSKSSTDATPRGAR